MLRLELQIVVDAAWSRVGPTVPRCKALHCTAYLGRAARRKQPYLSCIQAAVCFWAVAVSLRWRSVPELGTELLASC